MSDTDVKSVDWCDTALGRIRLSYFPGHIIGIMWTQDTSTTHVMQIIAVVDKSAFVWLVCVYRYWPNRVPSGIHLSKLQASVTDEFDLLYSFQGNF